MEPAAPTNTRDRSPDAAVETADLSPQQAEELNRLGTLQQVYRSDPASRGKNAALLWVGFVFFLGVAVLLLAVPFLEPPKGAPKQPDWVFLSLAVFPITFTLLCVWRLRQIHEGSEVRILVFSEGVARVDWPNMVSGRWDEVESVRGLLNTYRMNNAPVGQRFRIEIIFRNGVKLRVDSARDHLAGQDVFFQRVSGETARCLLPRYISQIEAGETKTFGPLAVSKAGVHWGRHLLGWTDSDRIDFQHELRLRNVKGLLVQPWLTMKSFPVDNFLVFVALCELYLRRHGRPVASHWAAVLGIGENALGPGSK